MAPHYLPWELCGVKKEVSGLSACIWSRALSWVGPGDNHQFGNVQLERPMSSPRANAGSAAGYVGLKRVETNGTAMALLFYVLGDPERGNNLQGSWQYVLKSHTQTSVG